MEIVFTWFCYSFSIFSIISSPFHVAYYQCIICIIWLLFNPVSCQCLLDATSYSVLISPMYVAVLVTCLTTFKFLVPHLFKYFSFQIDNQISEFFISEAPFETGIRTHRRSQINSTLCILLYGFHHRPTNYKQL